jgi:hypothetical protein
MPSADKVIRSYLDINESLFLSFQDTPFIQLAKDFIANKVMIEGKPLKENFELETKGTP